MQSEKTNYMNYKLERSIKPISTIERKMIYETPWIRLFENRIERYGKKGLYSVIERSDSVIIIPIFPENKTILLKQYRYPTDEYSWELPMGGINAGETVEEAAKRELSEETGLESQELRMIGQYCPIPGLSSQKATVFIAKVNDENVSEIFMPSVDEICDVVKIPMIAISDKIRKGLITNGLTLAGILFLKLYLESADQLSQRTL